jgi:hypothetical protein
MKSLNLFISITVSTLLLLMSSFRAEADIFSDINNAKRTIDGTRNNIQNTGSTITEVGKIFGIGNSSGGGTNTQPLSGTVDPSSVEPSSVKPSSTQTSMEKRQAGDNPPVKNGNPCIEELCINDEIKDLGHINWKSVPIIGRAKFATEFVMAVGDPRKGDQFSTIRAIGDPKAIATFSQYRYLGKIDSVGLQAMSKIQGFCKKPIDGSTSLKGEYINKKGQKVTVDFYAIPSSDAKQQKFIVVKIDKMISEKRNLTYEQLDDLRDRAKQKYQDTYQDKPSLTRLTPNLYKIKTHFPSVSVGSGFGYTYLTLTSQFKYGEYMPGLIDSKVLNPTTFMYFPGCGADEKIKI